MYEKIASLKASCTKINKIIDELAIRIKENKLKITNIIFSNERIVKIESELNEFQEQKNSA